MSSQRKPTEIVLETLTLMRLELQETKKQLAHMRRCLSAAETRQARAEKRLLVEEDERDALYEAVSVLAEEVGVKTQAAKKARAAARQLLEDLKIKPPQSLGRSRPGKKRRKSRKKGSKKRSREHVDVDKPLSSA